MVDDEETPWRRPLLVGVGALLGVAVLVGGVIGIVTIGAVSISGLGDKQSAASEKPTLYFPSRTSGSTHDDDPGLTLQDLNGEKLPSGSAGASATPEESQSPKPRKPKQAPSVISLSASPLEVAPMEKIYFSGTYPRGEGASLQVQRFEGGWTDFPSSTSVSGGTFTTYVMTGQSGMNKFRVVDPATGKKSNAVTVHVR
ncbi:MAG TPA: hypothetical protein VK204_01840 [Nocardioidaceae bacterium]|nr:hypothetical protein [Nocardioidaceae bacterium]